MNFENKNLFQTKLKIINNVSIENLSGDHFQCNYHGVDLNFISKHTSFVEKLKSFLPTSWHTDKSGYELYFLDPTEFEISAQDWCDESSQDCFDHIDNIGIQRDFVAKEIGQNKLIIIADLQVNDGLFNFLRWFLSRKLIDVETLILHSSCVLDATGKAHFFLGHSGAGKTTLTALSKPRAILGDDMNLLSIQNDRVIAQAGAVGGSFLSDIPYDEKVDIGSFNWLVQDSEVKRTKLNNGEAQIKLIASVSNIFWETLPKEKTATIMNIVKKAAEDIPMYQLHFQKSDSFWNLIEK